jgi:osmoprotectant transport system ATP-binding protein
VSVIRGGRAAVRDVDLVVRRGETLVLLGRSGSGKTTILKLINRLLEPSAGAVMVEGRSTLAWDPIRLRRRIGYVIQEVGLLPHLTVARNVGLVPELEGWPAGRIHARVAELLGRVGLDPEAFGPRYPAQLSGGQRQRVGVARALAADPPLLLMDEPFGALDPITRAELQDEFIALAADLGKTIVFVTHDVLEGWRVGSRLALVHEGRVVAHGTAAELSRSAHPEVAALLRAGLRAAPEVGGGPLSR